MSLKKVLARLLMAVVLQLGALSGVKMHPEEIEKLLNLHNATRVVHIMKKDDDVRD